jgi:ATP/maltotriose-dependent transcriptional regulator MalT
VTDYARMRTAAFMVGDHRREGLALAYGGMAAYYGHDFEAAESLLRHALDVSHEAYAEVRLSASIQLSAVLLVTGRHDEAAPFLRMAEDLAAKVDDPLSRSWWAITGSEVLHWSGQYGNALKLLERWQPAVVASNQMLMHLWTKWETALACGGSGDYSRALRLLNEVIVACAETGESFIRARALNTAGWLHCELQDHVRALELNAQSLALTDVIETADTEIANNARLNLGDSYFALGRLAEADEQYRAVEQIVRNPRPHDRWMVWRYSQHLFHSYGALALARGQTDTALALADECLQTACSTNSPKNIAKARRLRGEVFIARGDLAGARVELAQALEVARRLGNPPQLWRTLIAIGVACQAEQKGAAAQAAYREAVMVMERVASELVDEQLRSAFLGSSEVEDVRRRASASFA